MHLHQLWQIYLVLSFHYQNFIIKTHTILLISFQFKTFKPFFVSLNLPYSVIRGEEVVLQGNIFNYMGQDVDVSY